jgi:quercetin dioxygenase-like cupin family protein
MHNQHDGLSQLLAHEHIHDLREQAAHGRVERGGGGSRRQHHRRRILTAVAVIAAVAALIGTAWLVAPVQATQTPPQVTTTVLAKSLFDRIRVRAHDDDWKAQLKTHGQSDVYVVDNQFPPGSATGWHTHPGPSLILVVAGTVTNYTGDDRHCTSQVYTAGDGFIDPGSGDTHMLRNETGDPAETIAVQLLPKDAVRRLPADVPSSCPS